MVRPRASSEIGEMKTVDDEVVAALAYVDECLPASERRRFEEKLAGDADLAAEVEEWRFQSEAIRLAFAESVEARGGRLARETTAAIRLEPFRAPLPPAEPGSRDCAGVGSRPIGPVGPVRAAFQGESLLAGRRARSLLQTLCAMVGGILLTGLSAAPAPADLNAALTPAAMAAYRVYSEGSVEPVETATPDVATLEQWLQPQFHRAISAPNFTRAGFRLLGGRVLPGARGPIAFALYENIAGARVGVAIEPGEGGEASLTVTHADDGLRAIAFSARESQHFTIVSRLEDEALEDLVGLAEPIAQLDDDPAP
jgi:anti-sigma factor RsiW